MPKMPVLLAGFLFFLSSCVSSKIHRAEVSAREQCEAREKVLVQEGVTRKEEAAALIKQVADLNRTLGTQDAEIRTLKQELTVRTQQMGESSVKLINEKTELEKDLAGLQATLVQKEALLERIAATQKSRNDIVSELRLVLNKSYGSRKDVEVEIKDETVLITLPDKVLYDKNGQAISATGRDLLEPLANLLSSRPELDVEVRAYTDNTLPKVAKNLDDTWEWSLVRATNLVRLLIREFNINANQLTPVGKGEFYPVTSNATAEGREKNRRTVLAITPTLPPMPDVRK